MPLAGRRTNGIPWGCSDTSGELTLAWRPLGLVVVGVSVPADRDGGVAVGVVSIAEDQLNRPSRCRWRRGVRCRRLRGASTELLRAGF